MAGLEAFAEKGVLGLLCLLLIGWCVRLYKNGRADRNAWDAERATWAQLVSKEQQGRLSDVTRMADVAMKLHAEVIASSSSIDRQVAENAKSGRLVQRMVLAMEGFLEAQRDREDREREARDRERRRPGSPRG